MDATTVESTAISPTAVKLASRYGALFESDISAGAEFGYKESMVVELMKLFTRYGALVNITNVIPPAISPHAMFRLGGQCIAVDQPTAAPPPRPHGALINITTVMPPAISTTAMFRIGRDSLDAEVRRELLDRAISGERLDYATVVSWAEVEFGYKESMVTRLMSFATRYGDLVDSTAVLSTAISPTAMFQLGRNNIDAEVRRELLARAVS